MLKKIETDKVELLFGVISDMHIPSEALKVPEKVIEDFKEKKIDYLLALGDYTTFEAYKSLIDIFSEDKVFAVLGNMDLEAKLKKTIPESMEIEVLGHRIFMSHGGGSPNFIINRLKKKYDLSECDIIIFGHTHHPFHKENNGKLYINPGSVNDKRFTDINSYGYLRISKEKVDFEIVTL